MRSLSKYRIFLEFGLISLLVFLAAIANAQQKSVIIDADTGNEVDDLYAIVRGLIEPSWDVVGLNATQWQATHWNIAKTMENSYRLNTVLLSYLDMNGKVKANRGAEQRLFDWGEKQQPSTAAFEIIKEAKKMPEGEKLYVITLGALTNVASALLMDVSITDKIVVYWLGTKYNFEENYLTKTDFNCVMDIQAVNVLMQSDVEWHIFPVSVANQMSFDWEETKTKLEGQHDLCDYLLHRWYTHIDSGRKTRTIWDLTIIDAVIFPNKVQEVKITTSKENGEREIYYYKSFDADFFRDDFFKTTLAYVANLK